MAELQDDLLHPLATLHWEKCDTLRIDTGILDFAVLHNRVALVTYQRLYGNALYISSTDLISWTTITLAYQHVSLTTYQSRFVVVGGRHPTTHECTNKLFTSDMGLQWQLMLPPMPTKRHSTTSVSMKSPEALVVAGGVGLGGDRDYLDVVEVLLEEQWSTVDPLPKKYRALKSTLHNGNFYFVGVGDHNTTVYTCSSSLLLSSSCQGSSNISTTDRPLWRQSKVPYGHCVAISYSSRLVLIYGVGNVYAYSSTTRSWVKATSTGFWTYRSYVHGAATVLPTGELVYAHRDDGLFRVKLTVSSFNPEMSFRANVLTRLEAVMGIQIILILANLHTQLTATSGVQLQASVDNWGIIIKPLPDPQVNPGRYIEEVMLQWSSGRSHRPPTWRHLLETLQDIGLLELTQQIDTFIKGEVKFIDAYRHFISTKDVLELLFLKFIFVGPPRLGKTTLRRRLMGEITDLLSAGEAEQSHPSTAAVESGHSVIVRNLSSSAAVVTQAEWSAVENLSDEARMLFYNFLDSMGTSELATSNELNIPTTSFADSSEASSTRDTHHPPARSGPNVIQKLMSKMKALSRSQNKYLDISEEEPLDIPEIKTADVPEILDIIKQLYRSDNWKGIKHIFKAFLRMEDTGGQPELMDMLPALTVGPGLYLLFVSYEFNLKSKFKVIHQSASGEHTLPEESTFTLEEMLLSALSSISCSNSCGNLTTEDKASSSEVSQIIASSKSVAYIVGIHKDRVTDEHIASFDKKLQKVIRETDFYESNLVQFCSESKLVISIDNLGGGTDEVNEVQRLLERAMEKHFKKLKIPAVWLLFSLCLRMREVRTVSMKDCLELANLLNMTPYETRVALWFLHHHAGVVMYFPNVCGLEDLVIIDNQVVYDSVTCIILQAMTFDKVGKATAERFRRTGQLVLKDLIAATSNFSGDLIPPLKLVALLEYLHILARIPLTSISVTSTEDEVRYIMPCVLQSASKEKLDTFCQNLSRPLSIGPLMFRYKCGFVPIGVFPALIASLTANSSFQLVESGIMKNLVQYRYGSLLALVTFICRPKFYEVIISELPLIKHEPHRLCLGLRKEVVSALEKVSLHMNYGYFMDYQFAFECPIHLGREHLCIVHGKEESPKLMVCQQDPTNQVPVVMTSCHRVWFGEPQVSEVSADASSAHDAELELSISSVGSVFTSALPTLVEAIKPSVHSVADHCLSVGLISGDTYETILQRHDLINSDKARILINDVRNSVCHKPESICHFLTVLHNIGGLEDLICKLEKISLL